MRSNNNGLCARHSHAARSPGGAAGDTRGFVLSEEKSPGYRSAPPALRTARHSSLLGVFNSRMANHDHSFFQFLGVS